MSRFVEQLSPRGSLFAEFDARWKLAALLIGAAMVAMVSDFRLLALALALALCLALVARVPVAWGASRVGSVLFSLMPFFLILPLIVDHGGPLLRLYGITLYRDGLFAAAALLCKATAIIVLMLIALSTSPLHVTLRAAQRLHVPGLLILLTVLAYRYIFLMRNEWGRLWNALRVRGFRNRMNAHSYHTIGQMMGTLLIRGADRAERVSQAMRCRGFDGRFHSLDEFRTTKRDVIMFLLIVLSFTGLVLADDRIICP